MKVSNSRTGYVFATTLPVCKKADLFDALFLKDPQMGMDGEWVISDSYEDHDEWDEDNVLIEYSDLERRTYFQNRINENTTGKRSTMASTAMRLSGKNNDALTASIAMLGAVVEVLAKDQAVADKLANALSSITGADQATSKLDVKTFSNISKLVNNGDLPLPFIAKSDPTLTGAIKNLGRSNAQVKEALK